MMTERRIEGAFAAGVQAGRAKQFGRLGRICAYSSWRL